MGDARAAGNDSQIQQVARLEATDAVGVGAINSVVQAGAGVALVSGEGKRAGGAAGVP